MSKGIWIFIEHAKGEIRKVSLELLSQGRILADEKGEELVAVILGKDGANFADTVGAYGADKAVVADDDNLAEYTTGAYTSALNTILRKHEPSVLLLGNTAIGKDLAPRLAQRLGVGMASDVTGIVTDADNVLSFNRPIYAGKVFTDVVLTQTPVIATVRPNTFAVADADDSKKAEVITESVEINAEDLKAVIKEIALAASERPDLIEADIIVSGGRGMKGPENYVILEELADVIGAAVGASRAAVDAGWIDQKFQVGQTGKTVSPTLYIAAGISGAIQHLAGMGSSKVIVAINKDPEANIFTLADYGIVGDLFEIVPLLTEEFKKLKA
jgi:electron transfer flavoprotein alpha subunit